LEEHEAREDAPVGELVARCRAGDDAAFDDLVRRFQGTVFGVAYRILNHYEEATDAAQEVFVKVFRNLGAFRGESQFSTWLYAVTANTCRSRLRRVRRARSVEGRSLDDGAPDGEGGGFEPVAPGASPAELLARREIRERVEAGIAALPADFSAVMVMRDIEGLSYEEIAEAMSCSLGTVKSRLSRARNMVKENLKSIFEV
jgi:RNA polymerase sigma-70 factor (ECF subfamily)